MWRERMGSFKVGGGVLMGPRKNCGKQEMGTQSRPLKCVKVVGLMVVDHKPSSVRLLDRVDPEYMSGKVWSTLLGCGESSEMAG
jgi:hypothetical protein